jgi:hypothetical protein
MVLSLPAVVHLGIQAQSHQDGEQYKLLLLKTRLLFPMAAIVLKERPTVPDQLTRHSALLKDLLFKKQKV